MLCCADAPIVVVCCWSHAGPCCCGEDGAVQEAMSRPEVQQQMAEMQAYAEPAGAAADAGE